MKSGTHKRWVAFYFAWSLSAAVWASAAGPVYWPAVWIGYPLLCGLLFRERAVTIAAVVNTLTWAVPVSIELARSGNVFSGARVERWGPSLVAIAVLAVYAAELAKLTGPGKQAPAG